MYLRKYLNMELSTFFLISQKSSKEGCWLQRRRFNSELSFDPDRSGEQGRRDRRDFLTELGVLTRLCS
jgi:hypothetical protein